MSARGAVRAALAMLCALGTAQVLAGAAVPAKAFVAQRLLDRAFARSLATHRAQRPWPWADTMPVARLRVPRLGVTQIVLDAGSGQAMAFGATILPGGARPGARGTTVLAAHRDTHFRFLQDLRGGDLVLLDTIDGRERAYRVTGAQVVRWDAFGIDRAAGAGALALATCYPFGALGHGPLRYVVHAAAVTTGAGARA